MRNSKDTLRPGVLLDDYRLLEVLGAGGFGIVYLARHRRDGARYAIKEYFPCRLVRRLADGTVTARSADTQNRLNRGRKLFFQEASALAELKHPNIVDVVNFFRANGTVYMVMAYQEGANLQDYLKKHKGGLSEKFLRIVFPRLLDGLGAIHAHNLLHLDIKPGNIHILRGGRPILLDFGGVHGFAQSRKDQPSQVVTTGFSAPEQYRASGLLGPWTDIYSVGATMRACIEGTSPPSAKDRARKDRMTPAAVKFKKRYSPSLLTLIDQTMDPDPLCRPRNVGELRELLSAPQDGDTDSNLSTLEKLFTRPITLGRD
jgi:serine/threonine protein kinase